MSDLDEVFHWLLEGGGGEFPWTAAVVVLLKVLIVCLAWFGLLYSLLRGL